VREGRAQRRRKREGCEGGKGARGMRKRRLWREGCESGRARQRLWHGLSSRMHYVRRACCPVQGLRAGSSRRGAPAHACLIPGPRAPDALASFALCRHLSPLSAGLLCARLGPTLCQAQNCRASLLVCAPTR